MKLLSLEEITTKWSQDCVIDDVMLDTASIKIPQLHAKYLAIHNTYTLLLKKGQQELKKLQHKKSLYYGGKASPEEYDEPFNYKVQKSEVPLWVQVDDDIIKVESKVHLYETTLSALADILKQIHQMSYNIRNTIEWRRFVNGS